MTREEKIAERLQHIPQSFRATYKRAVSGKGFRAAISAQCLECCGWQREEVKNCADLACPLWLYRPVRGVTGSTPRTKICREQPRQGKKSKVSSDTMNVYGLPGG